MKPDKSTRLFKSLYLENKKVISKKRTLFDQGWDLDDDFKVFKYDKKKYLLKLDNSLLQIIQIPPMNLNSLGHAN